MVYLVISTDVFSGGLTMYYVGIDRLEQELIFIGGSGLILSGHSEHKTALYNFICLM